MFGSNLLPNLSVRIIQNMCVVSEQVLAGVPRPLPHLRPRQRRHLPRPPHRHRARHARDPDPGVIVIMGLIFNMLIIMLTTSVWPDWRRPALVPARLADTGGRVRGGGRGAAQPRHHGPRGRQGSA